MKKQGFWRALWPLAVVLVAGILIGVVLIPLVPHVLSPQPKEQAGARSEPGGSAVVPDPRPAEPSTFAGVPTHHVPPQEPVGDVNEPSGSQTGTYTKPPTRKALAKRIDRLEQRTPETPTPPPTDDPWLVLDEVALGKGESAGLWVDKTDGADMGATWDCNGWERGSNPIQEVGQVVKICALP